MHWAVYLWPGLPQLSGRGSWSALVVAIGAAALLNVALLGTFVWTELLSPDLRILYWLFLLLAWSVSATLSGWLRQRERSLAGSETNETVFSEAVDYYLQGNWFEAERALSRLLRKNRRDVESRLMLATLLRHTGRIEEAARQLDVLVRLEEAQTWEQEIRHEAELLERVRAGEETNGDDEGIERKTEPPAEMMNAA
jgi:tetratricopeptide (TPR) repeat protein